MEKDIIIGLSLMWVVPISVLLLFEVCKLWQEVNYLEDRLDDLGYSDIIPERIKFLEKIIEEKVYEDD